MLRLLLPIVSIAMQAIAPAAGSAASVPPSAPSATADAAPSPRLLHLDDVARLALQRQPLLLQARASTEAAEGRKDQARSPMLPQITGTAAYEHAYGVVSRSGIAGVGGVNAGTVPSTSTGGGTTFDIWSFAGNATQLLWDFGQSYERFKAAGRAVDSLHATEQTTSLQVLLNVRKAFFQARAQHALIKVGEETLANELRHLAQVEGFVAVGTQPEIALAQTRTDVANDRVALINAQNGYQIAKSQLNQAMGVQGDTAYDVADEGLPEIDGEGLPNERLIEAAMKRRPELLALERAREANELTVRALKGAYGPTLSASGGVSEGGLALDALVPGWNVGASLVWPLFQGGLTRGQVREASANVKSAEAQLDAERLQIRFDVDQAVLTVRAAKAAIEAGRDALANARLRLQLAEGRYSAGVGSIIELGDAQVALTSTSAQLVQADYNLATARAELLSALGRP